MGVILDKQMKFQKPGLSLKKLLSQVYVESITSGDVSLNNLTKKMSLDKNYVITLLQSALKEGLITKDQNEYKLTLKGRKTIKVVMAGGAFDIIHPGHIFTLNESKSLGDVLIVSVARDKTVIANKGHASINSEEVRSKLVSSLRIVDAAILGSETDIFETIERARPDIIAIGYDQKHNEEQVKKEATKRGIRVKASRLSSPIPYIKSSQIVQHQDVFDDF
jgi:cytidyltransferase-like protein